jgi:hypothetical protein
MLRLRSCRPTWKKSMASRSSQHSSHSTKQPCKIGKERTNFASPHRTLTRNNPLRRREVNEQRDRIAQASICWCQEGQRLASNCKSGQTLTGAAIRSIAGIRSSPPGISHSAMLSCHYEPILMATRSDSTTLFVDMPRYPSVRPAMNESRITHKGLSQETQRLHSAESGLSFSFARTDGKERFSAKRSAIETGGKGIRFHAPAFR